MKEIKGAGPPSKTLKADEGAKYRHVQKNKVYWMLNGKWTEAAEVRLAPLHEQKNAWVLAAQLVGLNLEQWIFLHLDEAAGRIQSADFVRPSVNPKHNK